MTEGGLTPTREVAGGAELDTGHWALGTGEKAQQLTADTTTERGATWGAAEQPKTLTRPCGSPSPTKWERGLGYRDHEGVIWGFALLGIGMGVADTGVWAGLLGACVTDSRKDSL
jgi:hypothetical protein